MVDLFALHTVSTSSDSVIIEATYRAAIARAGRAAVAGSSSTAAVALHVVDNVDWWFG